MSFEFLETSLYKAAKQYNKTIKQILKETKIDRVLADQLRRAALSILLNFSEGYGRFHKAEKRHMYVTARASVNECVACLDVLYDNGIPGELLEQPETIAKMLSGLINKFKD
jgi:four helix bundle protein